MDNPYSPFLQQQLTLRDELALDRTILANERTLLASVRTILALFLSGVTFLHFSIATWFSIIGAVCLITAVVAFPFCIWRYLKMQKGLISLRRL